MTRGWGKNSRESFTSNKCCDLKVICHPLLYTTHGPDYLCGIPLSGTARDGMHNPPQCLIGELIIDIYHSIKSHIYIIYISISLYIYVYFIYIYVYIYLYIYLC